MEPTQKTKGPDQIRAEIDAVLAGIGDKMFEAIMCGVRGNISQRAEVIELAPTQDGGRQFRPGAIHIEIDIGDMGPR